MGYNINCHYFEKTWGSRYSTSRITFVLLSLTHNDFISTRNIVSFPLLCVLIIIIKKNIASQKSEGVGVYPKL